MKNKGENINEKNDIIYNNRAELVGKQEIIEESVAYKCKNDKK